MSPVPWAGGFQKSPTQSGIRVVIPEGSSTGAAQGTVCDSSYGTVMTWKPSVNYCKYKGIKEQSNSLSIQRRDKTEDARFAFAKKHGTQEKAEV